MVTKERRPVHVMNDVVDGLGYWSLQGRRSWSYWETLGALLKVPSWMY